jgi:hypothetical protein
VTGRLSDYCLVIVYTVMKFIKYVLVCRRLISCIKSREKIGQEPIVGSSEYGKKLSGSVEGEEFVDQVSNS